MGIVAGKHVLYFALQPPPQAVTQAMSLLDAARARHRLTAKSTPPERLHVSLNHVGDFKRPPGPVIDKALEAVAGVSERGFVVAFNRMGTRSSGDNRRPVVLWGDERVIGLNALYSTIHRALVKPGMVPRREAAIEPHMTLVRDTAEIAETFVEPVSWRVDEFVLIHAIHGEGRHEVVGRFQLSA